jgi:UDP-N-acetylglucosamine 1-carboxyvinyltransferase
MDTFVIDGGRRLEGTVQINGAKNAALPLMAAALLTNEPLVLRDVPPLADIRNLQRLLAELGCLRTNEHEIGQTLRLRTADESHSHAPYEIVRTMRAGICVLGPLLAKRGEARVSLPGGCSIGDRPVDLHLRGMEALGAEITIKGGDIIAKARGGRLRGARIFLGGPFGSTVLGTANVMSAATLAEGRTIIESAACEPEVVDLANMLTAMGAQIEGAGSPRITVYGVDHLRGVDHRIIADRIEAGTFMCAAAATNGNLILENCPMDSLMAFTDRLEAVGVHIRHVDAEGRPAAEAEDPMRAMVRITCERVLRPVEATTQPHPGFPTDLQAQLMALLCLAEGNSVITEKIFPERFLHVAELSRMGARLFRQGPTVIVSGVRRLMGAPVMASDLRASAGLVIAGMAAEGTTCVNRVYHLDRGYEKMEQRLNLLGAAITRVDEKELSEEQRGAA